MNSNWYKCRFVIYTFSLFRCTFPALSIFHLFPAKPCIIFPIPYTQCYRSLMFPAVPFCARLRLPFPSFPRVQLDAKVDLNCSLFVVLISSGRKSPVPWVSLHRIADIHVSTGLTQFYRGKLEGTKRGVYCNWGRVRKGPKKVGLVSASSSLLGWHTRVLPRCKSQNVKWWEASKNVGTPVRVSRSKAYEKLHWCRQVWTLEIVVEKSW